MEERDRADPEARIAYRILLGLVQLDGIVEKDERALLARFRKALRISEQEARALTPLSSLDELSLEERPADLHAAGLHVLEMLLRVAHADRRLSQHESAWLRGEAEAWGVAPLALANLCVRIEQELARERRILRHAEKLGRDQRASGGQRRLWIAGGAMGIALFGFAWWRAALVRGADEAQASLQALEQRCESALVFLAVQYDFVDERTGRRVELQDTGTGFFVREDGWIATSKHVAEPWKFAADLRRMMEEGYRLDESSIEYAAWREGEAVATTSTRLAFASFGSGARRATLIRAAPDVFVERECALADGGTYVGRMHAIDNNDLALLAADFGTPVPVLELAPERERAAKLDPVFVLGFPAGELVFERGRAECSATAGEIRKVEDSIFINASLIPGNSGGPLLDPHGHVLGVATRTLGDATMGCCIHVRYLRALMETSQ